MTPLDRRLHAFRPDLADAALAGRVEAARFVEGRPARIAVPVADLCRAPHASAGLDTQLIAGTPVTVFDEANGFAWVQSRRDGYVGYVEGRALGRDAPAPTHRVIAPRTFLYPGPDLRLPNAGSLSMGSEVAVVGQAEQRGTLYAELAGGLRAVDAHLAPLDRLAPDYVAVAELLIHTPYLWGGASAFGIDCSGLVQLALHMAGKAAPRDSDMQEAALGVPVAPGQDNAGLMRGDLVFWKGHVAIVSARDEIIHANGRTMTVARESLSAAVERIGYLYGLPTAYRRP